MQANGAPRDQIAHQPRQVDGHKVPVLNVDLKLQLPILNLLEARGFEPSIVFRPTDLGQNMPAGDCTLGIPHRCLNRDP